MTSYYDLATILREAETLMCIEGADLATTDMVTTLGDIKKRLSRKTEIDFMEYNLNSPEVTLGIYSQQRALYLSSMCMCHAKLAGFTQLQRYTAESELKLSKVKYFGLDENSLRVALRLLSYKPTQLRASELLEDILMQKLVTVHACLEKRVFFTMCVAHAIGLDEIVAVCAELAYQSLLKEVG